MAPELRQPTHLLLSKEAQGLRALVLLPVHQPSQENLHPSKAQLELSRVPLLPVPAFADNLLVLRCPPTQLMTQALSRSTRASLRE